MKRLIILLFAAALAITGCTLRENNEPQAESFTIYASFYPMYALSEMIIGDTPGMNLMQLVQPQDGCLRDYALSDWDFYLISRAADAVILGGAGLESFSEIFYLLGENGPAVIEAMSALVLKSGEGDSESHFSGGNPWLFLSVEGAEQIAEAVCANMIALDEPYASQYMENLSHAYDRFAALKAEMEEEFAGCDRNTPVAVMHEGLIYFADEWLLNTVCVVPHESGVEETEDSLNQIFSQLAECEAQAVLLEQQAPASLVEALEAKGYSVALLDTLSTGRADEGAEGYFTKMRENARRAASVLPQSGE